MEITLEDFNSLTEERSRRDVEIARLKMEKDMMQRLHTEEMKAAEKRHDELRAENDALKNRIQELEHDFANMRFENHLMKHYILLSVERIKFFFARIPSIELLSAIKSFVLDVLPETATPDQIAYANKMMTLPNPKETPTSISMNNPHFDGPMYDIHGNEQVKLDE